MSFSPRRQVAAALAAAIIAVLMIGAGTTYAAWSDSQTGPPARILSGQLTVAVPPPAVTFETAAAAPAPAGVVVRMNPDGTYPAGIVPGIQDQVLAYTVQNTGSARVPARLSLNLSASPVSAGFGQLRPYLQLSAAVLSGPDPDAAVISPATPLALPAGTAAFTVPYIPRTPQGTDVVVAPGTAVTVVLRLSLAPAAARGVFPTGSGILTAADFMNLAPAFTLTQVPLTGAAG